MLLQMALLWACTLPANETAQGVDTAAKAALAPLRGHTGFVFTELTPAGPRVLYGLRQDERFAIGSSFKLFVLGTLAAEVNADRQELANVMRLRADLAGPPHSELTGWPVDSPVTLHTLALKMISISDNTATDHLLHLLGRERVELQMTAMGDSHAAWNQPLLSTREMALLRDKRAGLPAREYQKLDMNEKRQFLADRFQGAVVDDALDFDTAAFDLAEWYATPVDMAHALAWLKDNTDPGVPAQPLREILTLETRLPHDAETWPYVGFKGGSEEQLLAGNWLLEHRGGRWYTFHVFYNNPLGKADQEQVRQAIAAIFAAIEKSLD